MVLGFERRDLRTIWNFFKMFVRDRFLGSRLGSLWAIANPALLFAIYTFVFGFVFRARLPGAESTLAYTTWLIAGYGLWLAVSEALTSAANSIHANAGIVKNMPFKTECLPLAASLMGLIPLAVSVVFLLVMLPLDGNMTTWHALAIVPTFALALAFVAGLGLGLAPLVAFYRDIGVALPSLLMMVLFASPIFYPISALPTWAQLLSQANPFYILTEWVREPLIFHRLPNPLGLLWVFGLTTIVWVLGLEAFRRVRGHLPSAI